jgi:REP element-mobilizing transposase RayT
MVMLPRQILPGTTYFVTRRCAFRQFLLRPGPELNAIFLYCLAYAAECTDVQVHAFVVMSNHWHGVLTDPEGRLPEFMEIHHKMVAKCVNAHLERSENVWSVERYSAIALPTLTEALDKTAYILANPVNAFLVRTPDQWPGLITLARQLGKLTMKAERPEIFFRTNGLMPKSIDLQLSLPPTARGLSPEEYQAMVASAVEEKVKTAHGKLNKKGGRFLGRQRVLRQPVDSTPTSMEWFRRLNPKFTGKNVWLRLEAKARLEHFITAYRTAWNKYKDGVRGVVFPAGTYWMKRYLSVTVASPG